MTGNYCSIVEENMWLITRLTNHIVYDVMLISAIGTRSESLQNIPLIFHIAMIMGEVSSKHAIYRFFMGTYFVDPLRSHQDCCR